MQGSSQVARHVSDSALPWPLLLLQGPKKKHGQRPAAGTLAEKLAGSQAEPGQELPPARFPRLLSKVIRLMLRPELSGQALESLGRNPYSGPFLQGLLRAVQGDT